MKEIYFDESNIKELDESNAFEKFKKYWGIEALCDSKNTFLRDGKRYKLDHYHTTPCVLMRCLDDDSILAFSVNSPLKNEFVKE